MTDVAYSKRELDHKFSDIQEKLHLILEQTTTTNGKVRKIIITVAVLAGVLAGVAGQQIIVPVLLALV